MRRNRFQSVLVILLIALIPMFYGCENLYLIQEPSTPLPAQTRQEIDAMQEDCKIRCGEYFSQRHLEGFSYKSHYNKKLNKCFLLTEDAARKSRDLYDIDESRHYGMFFHDMDGIYCNVLDTECNSAKEWNSLIFPYMHD